MSLKKHPRANVEYASVLCTAQAVSLNKTAVAVSPRRRVAASLLLLLLACLPALAQSVYVAPTGNDSTACEAVTKTTPVKSLNRGFACVSPGGTVDATAGGTYDELLVSQSSASRTCSSGDAAVQPGCAPIPNGLDADRPTRLLGGGKAILSPAGRQLPGGGSAITILDYARYISIEGMRVVKNSTPGSTGGIYIGNAQHITLTGNELDDGQIKAGMSSRYLTMVDNHIHHTGYGCVPPGEKPTPAACPHGAYICGQDHTITDNIVEYGSYYGIHVSCEQGGIARVRIERNIVRYNASVGIRCAGQDCLIASNLLYGNGQAITAAGSGIIAHNTIDTYQPQSWNPDPFGIYWGGNYSIVDNLVTRQKSAFYAIANDQFTPIDTSKVHHNLCSESGNVGCPIIGSVDQLYTNAAQQDYTLKRSRQNPALGAGVPVAGVNTDIQGRQFHGEHPSLGAYALTPERPPEPPTPPTIGALACSGELGAQGRIQLVCTPQEGRR